MADVTRHQKIRAFAKWGHCCVYCTKDLFRTPTAYKGHSIDHLIPESGGGGNSWENLVPACYVCNGIKDIYDQHLDKLSTIKGEDKQKFIADGGERDKAIARAAAHITREKQKRVKDLKKVQDEVKNFKLA
jgi:5-methylcytosine-specific restriction endonuclease McrA